MPYTVPEIQQLAKQINGIMFYYQQMLDDEFVFASATQVPQATTIFELVSGKRLPFGANHVSLPELLALIAYRYGFTGVKRIGHGGYAIVLGHQAESLAYGQATDLRRVMRLVPDHHVQDVMGNPAQLRPFDVRLDADNEPIRDPEYPLLLSDVFLLPRHTTRLVFHTPEGGIAQATGKPAILHCQVLPEVLPMNALSGSDEAGDLLEIALATLGVSVADAHGGNGGVLVGMDGKPLVFKRTLPDGTIKDQYIPVVLDYGYYSEIGPKTLATVLVRHGITAAMMQPLTNAEGQEVLMDESRSLQSRFAQIIANSGRAPRDFGRLLYQLQVLSPEIWINRSDESWKTTKEKSYPPLQDQARLNTIYPAYNEILFPQRIEEYQLPLVK